MGDITRRVPVYPRAHFSFILISTVVVYVSLAFEFSWGVDQRILFATGGAAALLTIIQTARQPADSVSLLILATHLGPIVSIRTARLGMVNLGDIVLALAGICILPKWLRGAFHGGPFAKLIPLILVLFLMSVYFSPDLMIAAPGALNMIQIGLVYFLTINEIKTRQDARRLLSMIGFTVLVCGLLHLYWYSKDTTLLLASPNSQELLSGEGIAPGSSFQNLQWYQKTSFFYVSFIASCNVGMVLGLRYFFLSERYRLTQGIYWASVLLIGAISSLVSGNRTPLIAALAAGGVMFYVGCRLSRQRFLRQGLAVFSIMLFGLVAMIVQQAILADRQRDIFVDMFLNDASTSMEERFEMWRVATARMFGFPKEVLIGIGPDVPVRGEGLPEVTSLMYIPALGMQVPSFHNFYFDVIFQLGIFFFLIMLYIILKTLSQLWKLTKDNSDDIASVCFFTIFSWLLLWNSHATGWSKPVMILAQLFALAHLVMSGTLQKDIVSEFHERV